MVGESVATRKDEGGVCLLQGVTNNPSYCWVLQGVTKEDIERAELALQAANKGIDLAAVSANKRSSENKENKPEGNEDTSAAMTRRKVWTDVSSSACEVLGRPCWYEYRCFYFR